MRVFDCFPFFNELDLLELRMRMLDDVVDYFVLAEAGRTYSNRPKPLLFAENRARFDRWNDRIISFEAPLDSTGLDFSRPARWDPTRGPWRFERQQRQALAFIRDRLEPGDVVMLSDVDEIPDPEVLSGALHEVATGSGSPLRVLRMEMHHYYLNMASIGLDRLFLGTCLMPASHFQRFDPLDIRKQRYGFSRVAKAGWHFSFLGGDGAIAAKIAAYSHQEFNRPAVTNTARLHAEVHRGRGVTDTRFHRYEYRPLTSYPSRLAAVMAGFPHHLLDSAPSYGFDPLRPLLRAFTASEARMEFTLSAKKRFDLALKAIRDRTGI